MKIRLGKYYEEAYHIIDNFICKCGYHIDKDDDWYVNPILWEYEMECYCPKCGKMYSVYPKSKYMIKEV